MEVLACLLLSPTAHLMCGRLSAPYGLSCCMGQFVLPHAACASHINTLKAPHAVYVHWSSADLK